MNKEEFNGLIDGWDILEYEQNNVAVLQTPEEQRIRKEKENYYKNMYREIQFLSKYFLNNYELNRNRLFIDVLLDWIEQFDGKIGTLTDETALNTEKRYAFLLARKVIYFNRNQMQALLEEVWDKMKMAISHLAAEEHHLHVVDLIGDSTKINKQLNASLFVPLSDSSHFVEFRHLLPEGAHAKLTAESIDKLLLPLTLSAKECLKEVIDKYKDKKNLFIIEDFSGSGDTAYNIITTIIENYHFENLFFCPLVITEVAIHKLKSLASTASAKGVTFSVIYGLPIENEFSIVKDEKNVYWEQDEKTALKYICEKYFKTHFKSNGYLYMDCSEPYPQVPSPYGFQNGGMAVILYSNCPNNSLPIIWSDEEGWKPLFPRHERYKKRI